MVICIVTGLIVAVYFPIPVLIVSVVGFLLLVILAMIYRVKHPKEQAGLLEASMALVLVIVFSYLSQIFVVLAVSTVPLILVKQTELAMLFSFLIAFLFMRLFMWYNGTSLSNMKITLNFFRVTLLIIVAIEKYSQIKILGNYGFLNDVVIASLVIDSFLNAIKERRNIGRKMSGYPNLQIDAMVLNELKRFLKRSKD